MHIEIIQWAVASQSNVMKTSQLIKHSNSALPHFSGTEDLAKN